MTVDKRHTPPTPVAVCVKVNVNEFMLRKNTSEKWVNFAISEFLWGMTFSGGKSLCDFLNKLCI